MLKLMCDTETTGINPMCDEIITAYFELYDGENLVDSYDYKSKVVNWSYEAQQIHGISESEMLSYPDKREATAALLGWLPRNHFTFVCFANTNTQLGVITYDKAIIQNEIMLHLEKYHISECPFNPDVLNVYDLAKSSERSGKFDAYVNPTTNRKSFTQSNVYRAIYGYLPVNAHTAKDDVFALKRIHDELLKRNDIGVDNRQQGMLL